MELLKDQTQKINTCSKSTIQTLEQGAICSKLTLTTVEGWSRSALVQIECHDIGFKQTFTCSKLIIYTLE